MNDCKSTACAFTDPVGVAGAESARPRPWHRRLCHSHSGRVGVAVIALLAVALAAAPVQAQVTAEQVRKAIERGQKFLADNQRGDGSWPESAFPNGGVSSLVMLALLESGMKPDHPVIEQGLKYLHTVRPTKSRGPGSSNTYVVSLQTMVYCLSQPEKEIGRIKDNVAWLEDVQWKSGPMAGMWGYGVDSRGDNSCTQFALLGLREAAELEQPNLRVKVSPETWRLVREHFISTQNGDGGWGYEGPGGPTGSMTVGGISSLIIAGLRMHEGEERIDNGVIENCGKWKENDAISRGLEWMGKNFSVKSNPASGGWTMYYLYGLERAARLSGQRFFYDRDRRVAYDWYREGADLLVKTQQLGGIWEGSGLDKNEFLATSFALLFLAKGRSPVLMNKLRHDSADASKPDDWNNDRNDVRHLTEQIARRWERRMTWQVVDAKVTAEGDVLKRVEAFLQAPVLFISGHEEPVFDEREKKVLKSFVDQGGFVFAEACCSREEFTRGFRQLCKELWPEQPLKRIAADHAIWKADHVLTPDDTLDGIDIGCRTSVVLSREDLSCYWEQKDNKASLQPIRLGTNVIAYATGKELLPDKLDARKVVALAQGAPGNRWLLQIAKLKHGGDWNVAPLAVPNLMASLRDNLKMNVAVEHRELGPLDQNLIRFPFVYMHGRSQFNFTDEEIVKIREHIERGGTLFADACCGREPFDTAFREFSRRLLPDNKLEMIPVTDELFGNSPGGSDPIGYDLTTVQFTKSMPRQEGQPVLEGIQLDGRWVVIYSKYDIGCALERHQGSDCRGYTHESAVKIATNVILYALLQ